MDELFTTSPEPPDDQEQVEHELDRLERTASTDVLQANRKWRQANEEKNVERNMEKMRTRIETLKKQKEEALRRATDAEEQRASTQACTQARFETVIKQRDEALRRAANAEEQQARTHANLEKVIWERREALLRASNAEEQREKVQQAASELARHNPEVGKLKEMNARLTVRARKAEEKIISEAQTKATTSTRQVMTLIEKNGQLTRTIASLKTHIGEAAVHVTGIMERNILLTEDNIGLSASLLIAKEKVLQLMMTSRFPKQVAIDGGGHPATTTEEQEAAEANDGSDAATEAFFVCLTQSEVYKAEADRQLKEASTVHNKDQTLLREKEEVISILKRELQTSHTYMEHYKAQSSRGAREAHKLQQFIKAKGLHLQAAIFAGQAGWSERPHEANSSNPTAVANGVPRPATILPATHSLPFQASSGPTQTFSEVAKYHKLPDHRSSPNPIPAAHTLDIFSIVKEHPLSSFPSSTPQQQQPPQGSQFLNILGDSVGFQQLQSHSIQQCLGQQQQQPRRSHSLSNPHYSFTPQQRQKLSGQQHFATQQQQPQRSQSLAVPCSTSTHQQSPVLPTQQHLGPQQQQLRRLQSHPSPSATLQHPALSSSHSSMTTARKQGYNTFVHMNRSQGTPAPAFQYRHVPNCGSSRRTKISSSIGNATPLGNGVDTGTDMNTGTQSIEPRPPPPPPPPPRRTGTSSSDGNLPALGTGASLGTGIGTGTQNIEPRSPPPPPPPPPSYGHAQQTQQLIANRSTGIGTDTQNIEPRPPPPPPPPPPAYEHAPESQQTPLPTFRGTWLESRFPTTSPLTQPSHTQDLHAILDTNTAITASIASTGSSLGEPIVIDDKDDVTVVKKGASDSDSQLADSFLAEIDEIGDEPARKRPRLSDDDVFGAMQAGGEGEVRRGGNLCLVL